MSKLRLGPLPKSEPVRLAITLSSEIKAELDRYAEAYNAEHGSTADAAALVPHMLSTFMARDRAFQRARQSRGSVTDDEASPASMHAAISSSKVTSGESAASE